MDSLPLLLVPDNFTPPSRTPWGGRQILERYKRGLVLDPAKAAYAVVGESWEISVEPDFPGRIDPTREPLAQRIATHPVRWLGARSVEKYGPSTPLLVKLLDAAEDLSVQVHPDHDYDGLAPDQCGKPETWFVVDREPGAGLYLGFRDGVTRSDAADVLRCQGDLASMLNFVPVEPGDFFVIGPGVAHAIGRGVTLVEPQLVLPGKRGVTYRFWDWNRRYDPDGKLDPAGAPRALHVEHALAVTAWDGPRGAAFVASVRARATVVACGDGARSAAHVRYLGAETLAAERVTGTGPIAFSTEDRLWGLTVIGGAVRIGALEVRCGRSAVLPAGCGDLSLELCEADAILTSAT